MKKQILQQLPLAALVVVGGVAIAQSIDNGGRQFPYVGHLDRDGAPVDGFVDLRFRLFASEGAASDCHALTVPNVGVVGGRFAAMITDVPDACLVAGAAWMDVAVAEPGSGAFVALAPADGARVRLGAVPFATAVPTSSSFLVGTGEIAFEDAESGAVYTLKGSDDVAPDDGVALRALSNPAAGEPLLRVMSSEGAERLRVEHDGDVEIDNGLVVSGAASIAGATTVGGRLTIAEQTGDASSGCQRVGAVMTCWTTTSNTGDNNHRASWAKPFANTSYRVTCTPTTPDNLSRMAVVRGRTSGYADVSVYQHDGDKSGIGADCIAIGPGGTW